MIQSKDFSQDILDIAIVTGKRSHFSIKSTLIKKLLQQIHENPDQRNIFWHLVELASFRGIFSVMRELLENNAAFKSFSEKKLQDQYFAFEQIIRLLRNILSHSTTADLFVRQEDVEKQKQFLQMKNISQLNFNMQYSTHFLEWKWSPNYHINLTLDISTFKDWTSIFDIIPLHQMYLLAELCNNLCEIFRVQYIAKKPSKTIWKKKSKS
jgi:hypothetical protein